MFVLTRSISLVYAQQSAIVAYVAMTSHLMEPHFGCDAHAQGGCESWPRDAEGSVLGQWKSDDRNGPRLRYHVVASLDVWNAAFN